MTQKRRYVYKRNNNFSFCLIVVVASLAIMVLLWAAVKISSSGAEDFVSESQNDSSVFSSEEPSSASSQEESVPVSSEVVSEISSEISSDASSEETASKSVVTGYPTPEELENVLFIGDSRTDTLRHYGCANGASFYSADGLAVNTVFTQPAVETDQGKISVVNALTLRQFDTIFINFGINELGWPVDTFIRSYESFLMEVKKAQPDADICVQNIIAVSAEKSARDDTYNNKNIQAFNVRIKEMTEALDLTYVDMYAALSDDEGNLPEGASADGVHPEMEYSKKWVQYLADTVLRK